MENSEAVNNSIEAISTKMTSQKIDVISTILAMCVLIIVLIIETSILFREPADKKEDAIVRHYTEVLRRLDEDPEDISQNKYESNIPPIIQKTLTKCWRWEMTHALSIIMTRKSRS